MLRKRLENVFLSSCDGHQFPAKCRTTIIGVVTLGSPNQLWTTNFWLFIRSAGLLEMMMHILSGIETLAPGSLYIAIHSGPASYLPDLFDWSLYLLASNKAEHLFELDLSRTPGPVHRQVSKDQKSLFGDISSDIVVLIQVAKMIDSQVKVRAIHEAAMARIHCDDPPLNRKDYVTRVVSRLATVGIVNGHGFRAMESGMVQNLQLNLSKLITSGRRYILNLD